MGFGRERPPIDQVDSGSTSPATTSTATDTSTTTNATASATRRRLEAVVARLLSRGVPKELIRFLLEQRYDLTDVITLLDQGHTVAQIAADVDFPLPQSTTAAPRPSPARTADAATTVRIPAASSRPPSTESVPAATSTPPPPSEAPPVTVASSASATTARRGARPGQVPAPAGWWDAFFADGGLLLVAVLIWCANGVSTIAGVVYVFPNHLLGVVSGLLIGGGLHWWITRTEMAYLSWERIKSPYVFPLLLAIGLDGLTATQGLLAGMDWLFPGLRGAVPPLVLDWHPLATTMGDQVRALLTPESVTPTSWPSWTGGSLVLLVLAFTFALLSERLLRRMWRGFLTTWHWRYPPGVPS